MEIDWRARLHPSARPQISTGASSAAKESGAENGLTDVPAADPPHDGRVEPAPLHRRREARHRAGVANRPAVSVAAVCRRHGIVTSMVFRWRVQFGYGRKEKSEAGDG